ncbi:MAG: choice-of-anchor B family protein [Flavobacteriales bacterium]|nr:choice-of-anchor B family protein [Flavobacteriales bacterium]
MKRFVLVFTLFIYSLFSFAQLNMSLLGQLPLSGKGDGSDIWGYVDEMGNEYALVGMENGVSVVDVTNPTNPTEVFWVNGAVTWWRDLKTWNDKVYITNEESGGLMIIDLSPLPGSTTLPVSYYTGNTYPFTTAHNLYIDENGYCYIFGANNGNGGAIILNLNVPTTDPNFEVGRYNTYYLHDGMVRGDTLWGGAINDGFLTVIDVSNKSNPTLMATKVTPSVFTHNAWISDDGHTVFTTDEKSDAYIAAYDVSDLGNITEIDRVQSNPGMNVIPHNVHVNGNFLVTSYYRDGVTIHDASDPNNIIEVGNYDTSPLSGNGFNGCWGVYPWLPSGNVIASDIEGGLFVLGASYVGASYLKGNVTDLNTSNPIDGVQIELLSTNTSTNTNVIGDYSTGIATAGNYNVVFSKTGYLTDTIFNVPLTSGSTYILDVQLEPLVPFNFTGQVIEAGTSNPIANAQVKIVGFQYSTTVTTNASGNFTVNNFTQGSYNIIAGKWEYITNCLSNQTIDDNTVGYTIILDKGYYDDFSLNFNWTVTGNAQTGDWEKGIPQGTMNGSTISNPDIDVSNDCGEEAFVTGNGGGGAGDDDVDGGSTILTSPVFDATSFVNPFLNYYRWFYNGGGFGGPDDEMTIKINNGSSTVILETIDVSTANNSSWVNKSYKLSDYITLTNNMRLIVETGDLGQGHLVEAGFDKFEIVEMGSVGVNEIALGESVNIYPNPFNEEFNVKVNEVLENIKIEVMDVTGKVIETLSTNKSNTLVKCNYDKGIYFVNVYSNGNLVKSQKLVKY